MTGKRGVDVVIEHVGGEVFEKSIRAVRNGGRIVTCGATAGFTRRSICATSSSARSRCSARRWAARRAPAVLGHVAAGRLKPVVHTTLPLAAAADGHRLLEARAAFGKVVLTVAA
jgi:NADPH:quinone reductase-like Zn-dependent oxidoreductase